MKSKIQLKTTIGLFTLVALSLLGFALLPKAEAVVPAPDGGYPNFTTAEGTNALKNLTTGAANTGIGWYSLFSDLTTSFNTGVGAATLVFNTGGESNTAVGTAALFFNELGSSNTAVGVSALRATRKVESTRPRVFKRSFVIPPAPLIRPTVEIPLCSTRLASITRQRVMVR